MDPQREELRRVLARKEEELARLRRAAVLISSRAGLEETLQAILRMALEVTGARYGIFRLLDADGRLVTRAVVGEELTRPFVEALPVDRSSITGWVATTRKTVCVADLREEPWAALYVPLDATLQMRSELAVPLIGAGGRLEGVLNLESPHPGAFGDADRQLLETLATQAVIAIQEVRLLDALQEIAERLLREPALPTLARICELACQLLNGEAAAVGEPPRFLAGTSNFPSEAFHASFREAAEQAWRDGRPVARRLEEGSAWTRVLVAPVRAGQRRAILGVLGQGPFPDTDWEARILSCLAHHTALAWEGEERREALRASRERRMAAESLAVLGDLAANMMHRLNNKVGTIPVRVQGIRERCAALLEQEPYLARNLSALEASAREAMEAVRQSVQELRPGEPAPVDLGAAVRTAIREAALPGAIRVELSGLDELPPVVAGERGLALIFVNLLENAARAMEGDGVIRLEGWRAASGTEVRVRDSGPGVAREERKRLFELPESGEGPHLGFGLWWVRTLMTRLGGSIRLEDGEPAGTTFVLRFPLEEAP